MEGSQKISRKLNIFGVHIQILALSNTPEHNHRANEEMDYDISKLEELEERLDAALAGLESARESKRLAELNLTSAVATIQRAATRPASHLGGYQPPGRFRRDGSGDFLREFFADPQKVLDLFLKESPDHFMTGLLEHHAECRAALERAEQRLGVSQQRVNSLSPTVSRCREFLRRVAA